MSSSSVEGALLSNSLDEETTQLNPDLSISNICSAAEGSRAENFLIRYHFVILYVLYKTEDWIKVLMVNDISCILLSNSQRDFFQY